MNSVKTLIFPPPSLPDDDCTPLTLGEAAVALVVVLGAALASWALVALAH